MIDELPGIIREVLKEKNIISLRPPQELSLNAGLLDGKNIVLSSPTSSGKTLVAEIAAINHFERNGKTLYVVPLKSLASEKYDDLKSKYSRFNVKTALSIGDLDEKDPYLESYDIIITTSEKADSLLRHSAPFIRSITCVVIDEVHLIDDSSRGPTLEVLITRLKELLSNAQFIALSATINNDKEISRWLNAELVKSSYRPVKLYEGVLLDDTVYFKEKEIKIISKSRAEISITSDTLNMNKQLLFFLSSRRNAEALASNLAKSVKKTLTSEEQAKLEVLADKVLYALEQPTEQCRKLSEMLRCGAGFHHAGLVNSQRNIVESGFRERLIKVLCATPTLAAGINLPAFRVVVRDLTRYSATQGNYYLPVLEVKQMSGRAGRPGFEDYGEAILIAKSESDKEALFKEYINGEVESVYSKLGVEPVLRTHVLALIANRVTANFDSLKKFFAKTFYALQYGNMSMINALLESVVLGLVRQGFITKEEDNLFATGLGLRVTELYLDPSVANKILEAINSSKKTTLTSLNVLQSLCYSGGINALNINSKDYAEVQSIAGYADFLIGEPNEFSYEYESFLKSIRTAMLFESWINEKTEQEITDEYKIYPGDLRNYLYTLDWLLYSFVELAKSVGVKECTGFVNRLRTRISYGIKDELFTLVSLPGIGRVRARKLFNAGVKNFQDVLNAPFEKIASIVGPGIANKLRSS